ncbi:RNA exonuclease 5 isoform X2 [Hemicordylus capensis]|nr:RNA exonuclease 5 isoform X2 [Hemicordylus capensis]XP_053132354.1 RNA exonuclease 5 isoform X2 [Hemicordylus capensis]
MAAGIQGIKKKRSRKDEEEPQKVKKKRKVAAGVVSQNQHQVKIQRKEKKPHLSAEVFGEDCEIGYDQLFEFLKYAALGKRQNAAQPSWCRLHHQRRVAGVVVVVLREVSRLHYYWFYMQFKHLRKTFRHRFSLSPVSDGFMEEHYGAGSNGNQQISKPEILNDPIIQKYGEGRRGLSSYILTPEEMCLNEYPLEGSSDCSHFTSTRHKGPVTDCSPLFGLDCEMCLTERGSELTRVSLVDASGQCLMDELVKPDLPIKNYLTRYSGITKKLLRPVTTKLADVQRKLRKLLPSDAVLVGHSLNADLQALQMVHPSVIDTSLLFTRKGNKRFKLKFLAEAVLGKEIQREDQKGHHPTEDARCALELAQYFINQGPRKVAELNLEARWLEQRKEGNSLKNGIRRQVKEPIQCCLDILHSVGIKTLLLGGENSVSSDNCANNGGVPNKHVLQRALEEIPRSSFSVIQFTLDSKYAVSDRVAEIDGKLRTKMATLSTLYAGPFGKGCCLKALKKVFKKYGHIQSIRVITETFQPHLCIQYEVLEAAQLAMESLDGTEVAGSLIKVQRPITEAVLDCEALVKRLEMDADNKGVIYVAGLGKIQSETDLQKKLGDLKDLKSLFLPRDPISGRWRNYGFLKFRTAESASSALKAITEQCAGGHSLPCRRALTPAHLHRWVCPVTPNGRESAVPRLEQEALLQKKEPSSAWEQDLKKAMKTFDCRLKKLYNCLPNRTLCIVLFPGTNRVSEPLPGFGLLGIKEESPAPSSS